MRIINPAPAAPTPSHFFNLDSYHRKMLNGLILLLPFIVFYWLIPFVSSYTLGNDYIGFPIPQQMELFYSLKQGTVPLYAPGFAGGQGAAALTLGQFYHPISHLSAHMPGYWQGHSLQWNTLFRLLELGIVHLGLFFLLARLRLSTIIAFIVSFITVYNLRMLDLFRYGASHENNIGYLLLCLAIAFYYLELATRTEATKENENKGNENKIKKQSLKPAAIIGATYLLMCGGHPQMMYLGLLGAGITAAVIPFLLNKINEDIKINRQCLFKYFSTVGTCILIGIILSAAYIIPFYYDFILTNGERVAQDFHWSLAYSNSARGLLNNFFMPLESEVQGSFGNSTLLLLVVLIPLLYFIRTKIPAPVIVSWSILCLIFLTSMGNDMPFYYYFWKYFPLATAFRIPGRLTMLFPFLFLLLLAWLFKNSRSHCFDSLSSPSDPSARSFFKNPPLLLSIIAIPVFLLYRWALSNHLPKLKFCIPQDIAPYPSWVDTLVLWSGFFTIIIVILYLLARKKKWQTVFGIILGLVIVAQVTVEFRVGTWVIKKKPQLTFNRLHDSKKSNPGYHFDPGYGLEPFTVITQKNNSIIEPSLAKFYRQYVMVKNQRNAYRYIRKEPITDTLVVEAGKRSIQYSMAQMTGGMNQPDDHDRIQLKYASFNRFNFSLQAHYPGFFVFSFPYAQGWQASVNGKPVPIARANGYIQAIPVGVGHHHIEFKYWSSASFWGMLTSCVTLLLISLYFSLVSFKGLYRFILMIIGTAFSSYLFLAWTTGLYNGKHIGTQYTWTSREFPSPKNLAYARKTFMNSGRSFYYPGLAVDGKTSGPGFQTDIKKNGYWQVDLGSPRQLGEIVIYDTGFQGRKHIPLQILGSIKGHEFVLLKSQAERGNNHPWRIPMNGEITRFVRIQSSSKASLSFSEIEIYPPRGIPGALPTSRNPLEKLIVSAPVTTEVLTHIAAIKQAVEEDDLRELEKQLQKNASFKEELQRYILYAALHESVITGKHQGVEILVRQRGDLGIRDVHGITLVLKALFRGDIRMVAILKKAGAPLSPCAIDMEPALIISRLMDNRIKSPGDQEIPLWNSQAQEFPQISPSLTIFGKSGVPVFDTVKSRDSALDHPVAQQVVYYPLRIRIVQAQKNDQKSQRLNFGYEWNEPNPLVGENSAGKTVHFIIRAVVPTRLQDMFNFISIRDFDGQWEESPRVFFNSSNWQTYIVSKKLRPGIKRLVLMIQFTPQFAADEMLIKDARFFITESSL